jgi:predicted O-methyltransferase YrrM
LLGRFHLIFAYIQYWLIKEDQYSQHSPFVFKTYKSLLDFLEKTPNGNPEIESYRESLLKNPQIIPVLDLGAGSKRVPQTNREIKDITRFSTSSAKFCQIYQYLCGITPATHVIELGTCMGISTRYLAKNTKGIVYSFEGSEEILKIAQQPPIPSNINFFQGPIADNLPKIMDTIPSVDFALIDATHTYEGTLKYFNILQQKVHPGSILVIGDIHWSKEMEKAWSQIKLSPEVKLTIDFFECGVVFFEYPGQKKHLVLDC